MKKLLGLLTLCLVSYAAMAKIDLVTLPASESMQVTISNSKDLTLVRDTRRLTLKKGANILQFGWENTLIDPTSINLRPLENADKIDILALTYPARVRQVGQWQITSEIEDAVTFEITYFISGLSWRAFYMGTMNENETAMDLKGYVNVSNNSGQDFDNTQTRLIVGEIRLIEEIAFLAQRRYPYGPEISMPTDELGSDRFNRLGISENTNGTLRSTDGPITSFGMMGGWGGGAVPKMYEIKQIEKTGLSEYFLFTIQGTEDLTNTWAKRMQSFDVKDIPVKSLYKYDEARYGNTPVCFMSFANDSEHELGITPIPEGSIRIYRNVNDAHNLSYIGESNVKYIPVNEDIELNLGPARLVKVEPILIDQKTENYTFDKDGNIDGWDEIETYNVTVTNTRDIPVDIEITWNMGTDSWELDLMGPVSHADSIYKVIYKKHDKDRGRFTLTVAPKTEKVFGHTIRKYRQKRVEAYTQKMMELKKNETD